MGSAFSRRLPAYGLCRCLAQDPTSCEAMPEESLGAVQEAFILRSAGSKSPEKAERQCEYPTTVGRSLGKRGNESPSAKDWIV
ncbi:hypothetical protein A0H81_12137 [Grifola frondosa]|uniref:Uncharacterized protein n=1 Tax=Grifola frondosa TaxID=5627 RepID=A0A1C7LUM6_GRIFR|nr:hypothetical protein A0H81_12137 [Grifola frondosa]